jgi:pimeloyl-ACP methyl ester carboxylesterase
MRPTWWATLVVLGLAAGPAARAADKGVEGSWEGTIKVNAQVELRITLDVKKAKDGKLSAKWGSPDQGANDLDMDTIALNGKELTFEAKSVQATYKGKLNEAGTEIAGDWTQPGGTFALTFKRPDTKAAIKVPKEMEGIWEGKLKTPGGELRLVLKAEKDKAGALKASILSPDQTPTPIPISAIDLKDGVLTWKSKAVGGSYEGKQNKDGTAYEGEFEQNGTKMPLTLKKTDKISEARRPQMPKPPFPYRAVDVAYENKAGNVKLAGTLTLPQGDGPFPAAILITGSGAQDRDETLMGHKPFLVLADDLTRRGIAVLRVDDRGVGGSTGNTAKSTSEDFAGDALAGIAFLKARTDINPKRIGLIGHSEGGLIAPMVAARSNDVSFIVLMAGPGLTGAEILERQGQLILKATGASEAQLEQQRLIQKRLIDVVVNEKDEKAAKDKLAAALKAAIAELPEKEKKSLGEAGGALSEAAVNQINTPWFRYFLTYDPRTSLRKVRCAVLAVNGEKDLQVPPKEDLEEIDKALKVAGNTNYKVVELPGLNHLFQSCKTGSPGEYAAIEETIAPAALKVIGEWVVEQTSAK